jgi:hypothetical protein
MKDREKTLPEDGQGTYGRLSEEGIESMHVGPVEPPKGRGESVDN